MNKDFRAKIETEIQAGRISNTPQKEENPFTEALIELEKEIEELRDDRVLLLVDEADQLYKGIIVIPDTAKEVPKKGTILMVGLGRADAEGSVERMKKFRVGQQVYFGKYAGTEFEFKGIKNLMIMREPDIIMTIKPK